MAIADRNRRTTDLFRRVATASFRTEIEQVAIDETVVTADALATTGDDASVFEQSQVFRNVGLGQPSAIANLANFSFLLANRSENLQSRRFAKNFEAVREPLQIGFRKGEIQIHESFPLVVRPRIRVRRDGCRVDSAPISRTKEPPDRSASSP